MNTPYQIHIDKFATLTRQEIEDLLSLRGADFGQALLDEGILSLNPRGGASRKQKDGASKEARTELQGELKRRRADEELQAKLAERAEQEALLARVKEVGCTSDDEEILFVTWGDAILNKNGKMLHGNALAGRVAKLERLEAEEKAEEEARKAQAEVKAREARDWARAVIVKAAKDALDEVNGRLDAPIDLTQATRIRTTRDGLCSRVNNGEAVSQEEMESRFRAAMGADFHAAAQRATRGRTLVDQAKGQPNRKGVETVVVETNEDKAPDEGQEEKVIMTEKDAEKSNLADLLQRITTEHQRRAMIAAIAAQFDEGPDRRSILKLISKPKKDPTRAALDAIGAFTTAQIEGIVTHYESLIGKGQDMGSTRPGDSGLGRPKQKMAPEITETAEGPIDDEGNMVETVVVETNNESPDGGQREEEEEMSENIAIEPHEEGLKEKAQKIVGETTEKTKKVVVAVIAAFGELPTKTKTFFTRKASPRCQMRKIARQIRRAIKKAPKGVIMSERGDKFVLPLLEAVFGSLATAKAEFIKANVSGGLNGLKKVLSRQMVANLTAPAWKVVPPKVQGELAQKEVIRTVTMEGWAVIATMKAYEAKAGVTGEGTIAALKATTFKKGEVVNHLPMMGNGSPDTAAEAFVRACNDAMKLLNEEQKAELERHLTAMIPRQKRVVGWFKALFTSSDEKKAAKAAMTEKKAAGEGLFARAWDRIVGAKDAVVKKAKEAAAWVKEKSPNEGSLGWWTLVVGVSAGAGALLGLMVGASVPVTAAVMAGVTAMAVGARSLVTKVKAWWASRKDRKVVTASATA